MTEKLKQPLFNLLRFLSLFPPGEVRNSKLLLINALCLPLPFFFYFAFIKNDFYVFIAAALLIIIFYLVSSLNKWNQKQALMDLEMQDVRERINLAQSEILEKKNKIEATRKKITDFLQLKHLTEQLSLSLSLEEAAKTLLKDLSHLFDSQTTIILYVLHPQTRELGICASQKGNLSINLKSKEGDIFDQWVMRHTQSLWIEDVRRDFRFDLDRVKLEEERGIRSLINVPLMSGTKTLGILRVDHPQEHVFDDHDLRFFTTIGDLAAVAIESAQLYERVGQLAIKDSLTGLYLRRYLLERLPEEISRELRRQKPLSFLMIDIDHFKEYNDKFGHTAGDIVLRTVGSLLLDFFKEPGTLICRYGGEEFSVLLPECSKDKALSLAQKVREHIQQKEILLRREKTYVTVSVGVAAFPKDAQLKEELIDKADQALYRAKQEGRNRVCGF